MNRVQRWLACTLLGGVAMAGIEGCDTKSSPTAPAVPLSRVVLSPAVDTLQVGAQAQFTATAYDTLGNVVTGVGFQWSSGDSRIFTVSGGGRVTGVGEGSAPLFVQSGGQRDTSWVTVFTDIGWVRQASGTSSELNAVFFQADGRTGVAVGAGGTIVRTTDAGATWSRPPSGTTFNLNGLWFSTASEGWAVGSNGTVVHTSDGGQSWARVTNVGVGDVLFDVQFAGSDSGWVVGGSRTRAAHRGRRRVLGGHSTADELRTPRRRVLGPARRLGRRGRRRDRRHPRRRRHLVHHPGLTSQTLESVWRRGPAVAWSVGSQGVAPRTIVTPDSVAWELRNAGSSRQLQDVHYPTDLIGYAVGFDASLRGMVLRTDDAGLSWQAQAARTSSRLNDVFFVDALRGWAVGEAGTIIHTARGGRQ